MNDITIVLTKSQVDNLIEWFEFDFIGGIRNNTEIDNMDYLVDMCGIYTKLKSALEMKSQTNFDRIKKMSAEELAEFIDQSSNGCACCTRKDCDNCSSEDCQRRIRDWLERKAEETV